MISNIMADWNQQNYYELLEVTPGALEHEIHDAYQRAKNTYSPDSPALYTMFSADEANQLNQLIEEAYSVLGNKRLRDAYDNQLKEISVGLDNKLAPKTSKTPSPLENKMEKAPGKSTPTKEDGKTAFGTYGIKPDIENEIAAREEFDGHALQGVREYKNITLEQIAKSSRISLTYLRAIENNDFTALPAPVYVRGFVAQFAKALGLNEQKVVKSFMALHKEALGKE